MRNLKPVLFSVSYAGFWGQASLPLEQFIRHANMLGYKSVELMAKRPHFSPLDWASERLSKLSELCRTLNIEVACLAAYTDFCGGIESPEVPFNEIQVQYVEALARLAKALKCPLVRLFTAYEHANMPFRIQWDRTVEAIRECCDRCENYGVTIGIQNHHDMAVHTKALGEILRDIDRKNCKVMLDPWSLCLRGEEMYETARQIAPKVVYTTIADYIRLPRFKYNRNLINYSSMPEDEIRAVPVGEGDFSKDYLLFIKGLKAGGYNGPVAYEMCSPLRGGGSLDNLDRCARTFLRWLGRNKI